MATILTKKSDTASAVPLAADLTNAAGGAELAVNATDKRLFSKTSGGTVVELGTNPSTLVLPSGSANGVAYLNGSKVVTSGSALTFSGSALGVNATSTDASMSIQALTANYASVLSLVANNDNGAQYNNISSSTSGGTVHWRIGGVAGTSQLPFSVGGSEQMRLTSTGLGIGTSSPAFKLDVNGDAGITASESYLYFYSNYSIGNNSRVRMRAVGAGGGSGYGGDLRISTRASNNSWNTDAMTLDASGNLLVGNTGPANGRIDVTSNSGGTAINVRARSGNDYGFIQFKSNDDATVWGEVYGTSSIRLYCDAGGTNGVYLTSGATSWTANSDERLKENLVPIENGLSKVCSLRSVIGNFISDETKTKKPFLIAQDVLAVLPEAVSSGAIPKSEDTTEYLGVAYTEVIPLLVAAIKEQQAIIELLKARLDAANL